MYSLGLVRWWMADFEQVLGTVHYDWCSYNKFRPCSPWASSNSVGRASKVELAGSWFWFSFPALWYKNSPSSKLILCLFSWKCKMSCFVPLSIASCLKNSRQLIVLIVTRMCGSSPLFLSSHKGSLSLPWQQLNGNANYLL